MAKRPNRLEEPKSRWQRTLEYLGGEADAPPDRPARLGSLWWPLWWFVLLMLVIAFGGQATKFIYIDF